MTQKVLIAGGGIGGLATALACTRSGMTVSLFERANAFTEVGAGIQLGPNVTKILHTWGLQKTLAKVAAFPSRLQVCNAISGSELGVLRLGTLTLTRYGAPYATIHRADLQRLLLDAVQVHTDVELQLANEVESFEQTPQGVSLRTLDGRTAHGDVLVGADGGWSRIRQQLLNDGVPHATGHLAYRAMVPQSDLPERLRSQQITAWLGPKFHVVQYPVRGGEWLNVVAIVHGQVTGSIHDWDHNANAAVLHHLLSATCTPLQDLIRAIDCWRLWGLSIRAPMRSAIEQAQGRVALLGDAAHPMLPYLAQGAAMAIEDANQLAQALNNTTKHKSSLMSDIPTALHKYATQRWSRNARVQAHAIRNGHLFHASGMLRWSRDMAMNLLGELLMDMPWLYRGV